MLRFVGPVGLVTTNSRPACSFKISFIKISGKTRGHLLQAFLPAISSTSCCRQSPDVQTERCEVCEFYDFRNRYFWQIDATGRYVPVPSTFSQTHLKDTMLAPCPRFQLGQENSFIIGARWLLQRMQVVSGLRKGDQKAPCRIYSKNDSWKWISSLQQALIFEVAT